MPHVIPYPTTLPPARYARQPASFDAAYAAARAALLSSFFGPAKGGVYSPSVQYTLYRMGQAVLAGCAPGGGGVHGALLISRCPCCPSRVLPTPQYPRLSTPACPPLPPIPAACPRSTLSSSTW